MSARSVSARLSIVALIVAAALAGACGSSSSTAPSVPVIPQYAGNWAGTYVVTGCNQNGGIALANICGILGGSAPYGFQFTQSGRSVSGSFSLGTISFPNVGGSVGQDGSLQFQGTSITNGITVVVNWSLNMPAQSPLGTVTQVWQSNTLTGVVNVVGTISTANRTSFVERAALMPRTPADLAHAATIE